ncbi:MAG: tryptophan-rich sensory protein, partial [Bacteroidota bacterium]
MLAFHYQFIWASVMVMLTILGTLILINLRLGDATMPTWVNWIFQVYFGWITVATVVNVSVQIYTLNVLDNTSSAWLIAILIVAMLIGAWVMWQFNAYA